ncbi:FAD-dependent oxidoreductase [Dyadobacter luticola]|uniref:FAD-dependent monooxygenase n=1 Tax=Dyadobacter luticola TaxID=1979387 RepID=A0A5R9L0N7_9BACT|nr:NAD(P)/FAD-dependent oxidoreductase [Dyadobacter luticola]TLV02094.1 FAD-dependent monooxygenase [Dyadobacter luticola]
MLLDNKKIAILGAGPGGLTLARLLQRKGADVKVYERDTDRNVRVQGATLDLHFESGLKAVEAMGLMEVFKETYRPGADLGRVVDKDGNILYDEHERKYENDFGKEAFRPEIDRGDLRDMLLDSLEPETVVWDSQFTGMTKAGDQWELTFKNGKKVIADIVVGADGGNSKVRPMVTDARYFYAGSTILQGNIENAETTAPNMHALLKGGKIYTHADGLFYHVSAKGDGSIDFYVSCLVDEHWGSENKIRFSDRAQLLEWFDEKFAGWAPVWREMFENVSLPLLIRPQYSIPFDQSWEPQANVTLLGDAAHLMPPSGEGVNLAMLDALELCECLTNEEFTDVQAAIAVYEKPMQERGTAEAKVSMETVGWMHLESAMGTLIDMFSEPAS